MKFLMPRGQQSSFKERTVWDYFAKFVKNPELGAVQATSVVVANTFSAAEAFQWAEFTPGGNVDTDVTGTLATWIAFGNITVPSWATKIRVNMMAMGWFAVTAATGVYNFRITVGTDLGRTTALGSPTALSLRSGVQFTDQLTLTATGSKALVLQATRTGGAGALRADTACDFTAELQFIP